MKTLLYGLLITLLLNTSAFAAPGASFTVEVELVSGADEGGFDGTFWTFLAIFSPMNSYQNFSGLSVGIASTSLSIPAYSFDDTILETDADANVPGAFALTPLLPSAVSPFDFDIALLFSDTASDLGYASWDMTVESVLYTVGDFELVAKTVLLSQPSGTPIQGQFPLEGALFTPSNFFIEEFEGGTSFYRVVPEPAAYAAWLGVPILGLAIWWRRRK